MHDLQLAKDLFPYRRFSIDEDNLKADDRRVNQYDQWYGGEKIPSLPLWSL